LGGQKEVRKGEVEISFNKFHSFK